MSLPVRLTQATLGSEELLFLSRSGVHIFPQGPKGLSVRDLDDVLEVRDSQVSLRQFLGKLYNNDQIVFVGLFERNPILTCFPDRLIPADSVLRDLKLDGQSSRTMSALLQLIRIHGHLRPEGSNRNRIRVEQRENCHCIRIAQG